MQLIGVAIVFLSVLSVAFSLQCKTQEGAMMLMYRVCTNDYQCATRNQITQDGIISGIALNSPVARLHNEGYQVMSKTVSFLQLIRGLGQHGIENEDDFAAATLNDSQLRESDIFYAIWKPDAASQLPRVFYRSPSGETDAVDCAKVAMDDNPIPRDIIGQYSASLHALNTYKVDIAAPPECNNINEDRILDTSTGEYYCSCRPGKVCIESTHMLPARITLLVVLAVAAVGMFIFITWTGGYAFYSLDKLEGQVAENEKVVY